MPHVAPVRITLASFVSTTVSLFPVKTVTVVDTPYCPSSNIATGAEAPDNTGGAAHLCDNTGPDWGPHLGIQVDEVTTYLETTPSVSRVPRNTFVSAFGLIPLVNTDGQTSLIN